MAQQPRPESSKKPKEEQEERSLPVLPVRDTVLFPHAVLPLTVGRESSVQLINSLGEDKTIVVVLERQFPHPSYSRIVRRTSRIKVHDENNESHLGDLVEIIESRPLSRTKRWALVRVVEKGKMIDLAAMRGAARSKTPGAAEVQDPTV